MSRFSPSDRRAADLVALGWFAYSAWACFSADAWIGTVFVRPDIAAVTIGCAAPFAYFIAIFLLRIMPSLAAGPVSGVAAWAVISVVTEMPGGSAARAVAATALLLPPMVAVAVRFETRVGLSPLLVAAAALAVVPATFADARCRRDIAEVGELVSQGRLAEAQAQAEEIAAIDPDAVMDEKPLTRSVERLRLAVADLRKAVFAPLAANATAAARLDRARKLAMLGRTADALAVVGDAEDAPSMTLRATVEETRGEYAAALESYRRAAAAWAAWRDSERLAGTVRAEMGVAYCLRKSGQYGEAESAYLRVLSLAPTAETHFLLAQFYEDAQQAEKARRHARAAMEMAPSKYLRPGEELIAKLAVGHFGCLGVYLGERAAAR